MSRAKYKYFSCIFAYFDTLDVIQLHSVEMRIILWPLSLRRSTQLWYLSLVLPRKLNFLRQNSMSLPEIVSYSWNMNVFLIIEMPLLDKYYFLSKLWIILIRKVAPITHFKNKHERKWVNYKRETKTYS